VSKLATTSKSAQEIAIDSNDEIVDVYDLKAPLDQIEEIVKVAEDARKEKKEIKIHENNYKPLAEKVAKFLLAYGAPKKVKGTSWQAIKKSTSYVSYDVDKLIRECGLTVEQVESCRVVKTTTYYELRGIKGEEESG